MARSSKIPRIDRHGQRHQLESERPIASCSFSSSV